VPSEHMKTQASPTVLVILALASVLSGAQTKPWQTGKILAVEKHEPEVLCCYSGTDAPLQSNVVEYDVSVKIEDTVYFGRYQTWTGYIPTAWAQDHLLHARPDKHFVYLKTPAGDEARLSLISRKHSAQLPRKMCFVPRPAVPVTSIGSVLPM
jgi:hypothetical protein